MGCCALTALERRVPDRSGVCPGGRAGRGGPWRPKSCSATFPGSYPGLGREALHKDFRKFSWVSANAEQLHSRRGLSMRPARTGVAPLWLLLVLSLGKWVLHSQQPTEGPRDCRDGGCAVYLAADCMLLSSYSKWTRARFAPGA